MQNRISMSMVMIELQYLVWQIHDHGIYLLVSNVNIIIFEYLGEISTIFGFKIKSKVNLI